MVNCNKIILLSSLALIILSNNVSAQGHGNDGIPAICYLPSQSNVSLADVLKLPTYSPNHVISYGEEALQFGELWLPEGRRDLTKAGRAQRRYPLVVLIHGGCWSSDFDIRHTHAMSTDLANVGYAVWAVEYRRSGNKDGNNDGGWPTTFNDVIQAIEFIPELTDYPIDTQAVALVGHSSGGHLALLAGAQLAKQNAEDSKVQIDTVVGLAAITDLVQFSRSENGCDNATSTFMQGSYEDKPKAYEAATLTNKLLHPQSLLIHGAQDTVVPVAQSQTFAKSAKVVEGAGHFDMIHPGTVAFHELLKVLGKKVH